MEHRRESGTPVNLNALLIGEKTVPKGCRIMHVSSHGMLLHCEPEDQPRTYNDGDSVDIHLTVQHNDEQKKLTIPSYVRHASDNSLDVEFHHPDPVLLDLIESYRTSSAHKLEATIGEVHAEDASPDVIPLPGHRSLDDVNYDEYQLDTDKSSSGSGKRLWFGLGSIALLGLVVTLAANYLYTSNLHTRVSALAQLVEHRGDELAEMQNRIFSASLLEGKYASLDARVTALGNALAGLDQRVHGKPASTLAGNPQIARQDDEPAPLVADESPRQPKPAEVPAGATVSQKPANGAIGLVNRSSGTPPAQTVETEAPEPDTVEAMQATGQAMETAETETATEDKPTGEPDQQPPSTATDRDENKTASPTPTGPWVINLMSSVDRQYLTDLARRAQASGIQTELNSAMVSGKRYWRLQVTGFASLAQAKVRANEIRQTLGIGEVWFLKRKQKS